jgi:hypothetical protein
VCTIDFNAAEFFVRPACSPKSFGDSTVTPSETCPVCWSDYEYLLDIRRIAAHHRHLEAALENAPQLILRAVFLWPALAAGGLKALGMFYYYYSQLSDLLAPHNSDIDLSQFSFIVYCARF